jgi:hypothetical protein
MKGHCRTTLLLLVLIASAGQLTAYAGQTTPAEGARTTVRIDPGERDLVLAEMRAFLQSVQIITQSLSVEDLSAAAAAARAVGTAAAAEVPDALKAKLPVGFKKLGNATHRAFDELALDAEQLGDPDHALSQLAALLGNCVGCHAAFRFE